MTHQILEGDAAWKTLRAAGGRCQCTGQCGSNHQFEKWQPALPCRAPHGCKIVRSKTNPGFWMLAGTDQVPLAYPEPFKTDKPEEVLLKAVLTSPSASEPLALCGRCYASATRERKSSPAKP